MNPFESQEYFNSFLLNIDGSFYSMEEAKEFSSEFWPIDIFLNWLKCRQ